MSGWYLQEISIEGFRGINNEGDPLVLRFKPEHVNSVSAPNGVGKTSIFDAVAYAITGRIQKLDDLPAAEKGPSYYLNRFHSGGVGIVALTLLPALGGKAVIVTVKRDAAGNRSVTATDRMDGNAILAELNREFVLLDGNTFHNFIDFAPQARGRSFAGLLGLGRYSVLRQALSGLANTRAFNNHFGTTDKQGKQNTAKAAAGRARANIKEAYAALVGDEYDPAEAEASMLAKAHSALSGIALLKALCEGRTFEQIDPTACVEAAKTADGTEARNRLSKVLQDHTTWTEASIGAPTLDDASRLIALAEARDAALKLTQGDMFRQLYALSDTILSDPSWDDPHRCPTCGRVDEHSVLDHVRAKIAEFDAVATASTGLAQFWTEKGWGLLDSLEKLARDPVEPAQIATAKSGGTQGTLSGVQARAITTWVATLLSRAAAKLKELTDTKIEIEKGLPEKLTAVVEKAEAARRLQSNLTDLRRETATHTKVTVELARIARVKTFLDTTSSAFATAEADASRRRLATIEPAAQTLFKAIMFEQVVPALKKRAGSEDLSIRTGGVAGKLPQRVCDQRLPCRRLALWWRGQVLDP